MSMYRLITGNTKNIEQFESSISQLLEEGYALEGPLIISHDAAGTHLIQAMIVEDYFLEDTDDEDEDNLEDE